MKTLFKSAQWSMMDQWDADGVVVTAITSNYDRLVCKHENDDHAHKFIAFVDKPRISSKWLYRPICHEFTTPRINAKIHKIMIHEYFPKAKYTVWIDGNIQVITKSLRSLVDQMGGNDLMVFRHSSRNCLFSEAHECMARSLDNKAKIFEQICRYTQEGFPTAKGLAECSVIIRKNNERTKAFNCMWWDEILRGSSRDQISFPYVQHKTGITTTYIPGTIYENEFFRKTTLHMNKRIYKDVK